MVVGKGREEKEEEDQMEEKSRMVGVNGNGEERSV